MAAIAASQVSLYPSAGPSATQTTPSSFFPFGKDQQGYVARKLAITGVTAGDTATPSVLGFTSIIDVGAGYSATAAALPLGLNPTANSGVGGLIVGTGPSNETIYLTVYGTSKAASAP